MQFKKIAEANGYLIGNENADKITSVSKKSKELPSTELHWKEANSEISKERYIYLLKKDNKVLMN